MKTLSQTETPVLNWSAELVSQTMASMKPKYRADQIAATVAASGNPSGV